MPDKEKHMQNLSDAERLETLGKTLEAKRQSIAPETSHASNSRMAEGFKYASEFSAAVLVGAALGYAVDKGLNSSPWGLLIGLILGLGGGVLNIIRAAQETLATEDLGQDLPETNEE